MYDVTSCATVYRIPNLDCTTGYWYQILKYRHKEDLSNIFSIRQQKPAAVYVQPRDTASLSVLDKPPTPPFKMSPQRYSGHYTVYTPTLIINQL